MRDDWNNAPIFLVGTKYDIVDHEPRLKIHNPSFSEFFRLTKLFITDPTTFVKIKEKKQDPIINIIRTVIPEIFQENQPFVRFPATSSHCTRQVWQHLDGSFIFWDAFSTQRGKLNEN